MNYTKNILQKGALIAFSLVSFTGASAFNSGPVMNYFNGPTVSSVTSTSAELSLSPFVLASLSEEEKSGIYFSYGETNQVCVAIYPIPESCLPKKTEGGKTSTTITGLKPNTSYTVTYKRDNTIRCITAPCPTNDLTSLSVEFTTKASVDVPSVPLITRNLTLKSSGREVLMLQNYLIKEGYMTGSATGYYGKLTFQAVKEFQNAHGLSRAGVVGPLTRDYFAKLGGAQGTDSLGEKFEGTVTAYSTACFADGVCSITVGGKQIVTTIGWSQQIVGQVLGIPDFGSIVNNVGAHAKVYAKKTADGYTLYGSSDYYVQITPVIKGKLPAGSIPSGDVSSLKDTLWLWQKTTMSDGSVITPGRDTFTVSLSSDGKITGTTDCNNFSGDYVLASDGFISFRQLPSTLRECADSQEAIFTGELQKVSNIRVDVSGNLSLILTDGSTMFFVKK